MDYRHYLFPENYNSCSCLVRKGGSMNKSARFSDTKDITPGPGAYNEFSEKKYGQSIGKSVRKELFYKESSPGPGTYEVHNKKSLSFTFYRQIDLVIPETPGPGAYSTEKTFKTPNVSFIAQTKRKEFIQILDTPGPGRYENNVFTTNSPK